MPEFDLTGKVAILTGGSRGLGREISRAFARHGATVVVASRKADACIALAEEITRETGREALGLACHVGEWAQCDALADAVSGTGGSIINISSIGSISPSAHELPYAAAKAGLNTLAGGMARAFAPHVRVNTIVPGPFLTDISKAWDMDAFGRFAETGIPLQRGGRPEEIVGAALYLASDASSYTNGAVIVIDGGMTCSR